MCINRYVSCILDVSVKYASVVKLVANKQVFWVLKLAQLIVVVSFMIKWCVLGKHKPFTAINFKLRFNKVAEKVKVGHRLTKI